MIVQKNKDNELDSLKTTLAFERARGVKFNFLKIIE